MQAPRLKVLLISLLASFACATTAAAQSPTETVVLATTKNSVTWADVYKNADNQPIDPYFHVRVFEKKKGSEPWVYHLVAPHVVVTPEALAASRMDKKAKTYSYKDVEFRYLYRDWLKNPATRSATPICKTDILDCLARD